MIEETPNPDYDAERVNASPDESTPSGQERPAPMLYRREGGVWRRTWMEAYQDTGPAGVRARPESEVDEAVRPKA